MGLTVLLPWVLIFVLDSGLLEVQTELRYTTQEECEKQGELIAMSMQIDLKMTTHTITPKCEKRP